MPANHRLVSWTLSSGDSLWLLTPVQALVGVDPGRGRGDNSSCKKNPDDVMSIVDPPNSLADVIQQLGNVDPGRIRMWPAPGTATAADVEAIRIREERLFELVDGILVEKVMGFRESLIAIFIGRMIGNFVASANLGLVAGADGMMRLLPKTVRIPDVAFIAWDRLPDGKVPTQAVPELAPSLAVEVLSASNTPAEMSRKRTEYFQSGVDLVWESISTRESSLSTAYQTLLSCLMRRQC
jgi:hypothetical protein